ARPRIGSDCIQSYTAVKRSRVVPASKAQTSMASQLAPKAPSSKERKFAPATPDALRNVSRSEFVFTSLRDAIWEGRFAPGERIAEEEIAHSLGVSRTPVRDALRRLQERGMLAVGASRSLVVAELSKQQVLELYAMREILEGSAARFAAQHATATEIEILYRLQRELAQAGADDPLVLLNLNRRLHQAIYEAAHNQYLLATLNS